MLLVALVELPKRVEVLSANGLLGNGGVAQGGVIAAMAEQFHDADKTHATAEQRGGIGVPETVGGHASIDINAPANALEFTPIGWPAGPRTLRRFNQPAPVVTCAGLERFDDRERFAVEGDLPFVVQLSQRNLDPVARTPFGDEWPRSRVASERRRWGRSRPSDVGRLRLVAGTGGLSRFSRAESASVAGQQPQAGAGEHAATAVAARWPT